MPKALNQITEEVMALAKGKGFGTTPAEINLYEKLALVHGEVSEAIIAHRKKVTEGPSSFEAELADIILRTLHIAGVYGIDMEAAITAKLEYNQTRTWNWRQLNEHHT